MHSCYLEVEAGLLDSGVLSGTAYPSDSCTVILFVIVADLESQLEIVSEVPGESIRFSSDGRLLHSPSLVRTAGTRDAEKTRKDVRRGRRAGPCDVREVRLLRESQAAQRYRRLRTLLGARAGTSSTPSAGHASSRGHIEERCASPATSRLCQSTCKVSYSSGRTQEPTITGERVRSGHGLGNNGNEVHLGLRRRIRRGRAPAARRPRLGSAFYASVTDTLE